jgi:hypothetical protein
MGLRLESAGTLVLGNELGVPAEEKPNVLTSIGLNYFVFNARAAGLGNTFAGKNFLLQISTEFVDCDNDGEKDDIKLGVFFDGVLYCNNYIYIPNEAQTLSTGVNFNGGNKGFAQFSSVRIQELTNADLGINKGVYTATVNGEAGSDGVQRQNQGIEDQVQTVVVFEESDHLAQAHPLRVGDAVLGVEILECHLQVQQRHIMEDDHIHGGQQDHQMKLPVFLKIEKKFLKAGAAQALHGSDFGFCHSIFIPF